MSNYTPSWCCCVCLKDAYNSCNVIDCFNFIWCILQLCFDSYLCIAVNFSCRIVTEMTSRKKRKRGDCDTTMDQEQNCIIHWEESNCQSFTLISHTKDPQARFQQLREVSSLRLSQPTVSKHRMEDICRQLPEELNYDHGYHRDCYQKFTNHLDRLQRIQGSPSL